jgi:hypothetical protein
MIAVGSLMLVGCQPSKVPVRGQVTLDGQPLSEAVIVFVPLEAGIKKTGASIRGGAYELVEIDGLLPGKYRVEVVDDPPLTLAHRRHRRRMSHCKLVGLSLYATVRNLRSRWKLEKILR